VPNVEDVRISPRFIQQQILGMFWCSVDDEYSTGCGIELAEDSLPFSEISGNNIILITADEAGGGGSHPPMLPQLPPGFSNLGQVICIDLPPGDGGELQQTWSLW
jgi:hypothetical protein